jgi:hypothetical protein
MATTEQVAAIARLEHAGYTVLAPAEAKVIGQVLPMLTDDEVRFVLGRPTAALKSALRKFGLG